MRRWIPAVLLPLTLSIATAGHALAPGDAARGFREGSNHHLGDDGFAALYGRLPGSGDGEVLRMHSHFTHVRTWLGSRDATKPELASRRAELLGYLDEYIAKGTTPKNAHVPWRTPVFIDDAGTICAVGYLIERSAGRALADKVAKEHRYNVLEDIAAAMPEVRDWVATSGFTLEELASVQPGYTPPTAWNKSDLVDGDDSIGGPALLDTTSNEGTWRSNYPNGARLAEGHFEGKRPHGTWRFYHPSGNLAAQGRFVDGAREGSWRFFHDAEKPTLMAAGSFMGGALVDEWRHYDHAGKLVARSRPESPWQFRGAGYLVHVLQSSPGIGMQRWVHRGNVAGTRHRLDYLADGSEQLYVHDEADVYYDAGGKKLSREDSGEWASQDCHWSAVRRGSARSGDVVTLNALGFAPDEKCDAPRKVPAARSAHLNAMRAELQRGKATGDTPPIVDVVTTNLVSLLATPRMDAAGAAVAAPATLATR